jgi:hypothetical protein
MAADYWSDRFERLAALGQPAGDLLFVGLIGRMMQEGMTPYQAETQRLIAEGLG